MSEPTNIAMGFVAWMSGKDNVILEMKMTMLKIMPGSVVADAMKKEQELINQNKSEH